MNWDYIAGFFDGEGNIHIIRIKGCHHQLRIRFYSSEIEVLEEIKKFLGYGQIYFNRKKPEDWNIVYELTITKKTIVKEFLENIKDLVILKKPQVDFVLNNYNFEIGNSNKFFDIDKFRSFITRKNVDKFRKLHTIENDA